MVMRKCPVLGPREVEMGALRNHTNSGGYGLDKHSTKLGQEERGLELTLPYLVDMIHNGIQGGINVDSS